MAAITGWVAAVAAIAVAWAAVRIAGRQDRPGPWRDLNVTVVTVDMPVWPASDSLTQPVEWWPPDVWYVIEETPAGARVAVLSSYIVRFKRWAAITAALTLAEPLTLDEAGQILVAYERAKTDLALHRKLEAWADGRIMGGSW